MRRKSPRPTIGLSCLAVYLPENGDIEWVHLGKYRQLLRKKWKEQAKARVDQVAKEIAEQFERQRQADLAVALARQEQLDAEVAAERLKEKHRLQTEADRADYLKTVERYVTAVKKAARVKFRRALKKRRKKLKLKGATSK